MLAIVERCCIHFAQRELHVLKTYILTNSYLVCRIRYFFLMNIDWAFRIFNAKLFYWKAEKEIAWFIILPS